MDTFFVVKMLSHCGLVVIGFFLGGAVNQNLLVKWFGMGKKGS